MKKKLSKQQLEIMKILWNSDKPLVASDILKQHNELNINTVQASLRVLVKKEAIEVADIVYSGTVLSRCYRPLISKNEYFAETCRDIAGDDSRSSLISSIINKETDLSELEELRKMIDKRKAEIEGK
ncbi:MAG: BlaI/MecI/CopY family transcriptional regulator [Dorea sp.]|nr:BlaI/MecI/CopY family transcriptional regulator [Dorea sp.]MCI9250148.1 BlaI/MecI/CopY family transcriptional regulator [Dorea sp.]